MTVLRLATAALSAFLPIAAWAAQDIDRSRLPQLPVTQAPPATELGPVDWVFLIDTSASMNGRDVDATVFQRVQQALGDFIRQLKPADTIAVFTFDADSRRVSELAAGSGPNGLARQVAALEAHGQWTHTGAALKDGLNEAYAKFEQRRDAPRPVAIVLFTDGKEDVRGIPPAQRVPISSAIQLVRDDHVPFVFYLSLGTDPDPRLRDFLDRINRAAPGNGTLIPDRNGRDLPAAAARIRKQVAEQAPPRALNIRPSLLDLGSVAPGATSRRAFIYVKTPTRVRLAIKPVGAAPGHSLRFTPSDVIEVTPEQEGGFGIELRVEPDAEQGPAAYTVELTPIDPKGVVASPRQVAVAVTVAPSLWTRASGIATWLAPLLAILGMVSYLIGEWVVLGRRPDETPFWLWLRRRDARLSVSVPGGTLQLADGTWTLPLHVDPVVVDALQSPLGPITSRIRVRPAGSTHEMTVLAGPVSLSLAPGTPPQPVAEQTTVQLRHLAQIVLGGARGHVASVQYLAGQPGTRGHGSTARQRSGGR